MSNNNSTAPCKPAGGSWCVSTEAAEAGCSVRVASFVQASGKRWEGWLKKMQLDV